MLLSVQYGQPQVSVTSSRICMILIMHVRICAYAHVFLQKRQNQTKSTYPSQKSTCALPKAVKSYITYE